MKLSILRGGLAALVFVLAGCSLTFDSTRLGVPVTMSEPATEQPAGNTFRITKHPVFFFWGAVGVAHPNIEDILAGQLGTGARIANMRVRVRSRWHDLLFTVITAGLIVPRSVTFEGVVVSP